MKDIGHAILLILLLVPTVSFAHHGTATNRPAANVDPSQGLDTNNSNLRLAYQVSYFGSTFEGNKTYSKSGLGKILHNRLSLDGTFLLDMGTFFEASVPVGTVHVYPETGKSSSLAGISDISLRVGQRISITVENNQRLSFAIHAGTSLATGTYNSDSLLSKTDISAGEMGQIDVATFNMNTSLGRDI